MIPVKSDEKSPLVYVLIVNFNGEKWLNDCLGTVYQSNYNNFRVVLIDNDSTDDSVEFVRLNFPQTTLVVNESNLGFCEGNNIGISIALKENADYIVLLNNDTKVTKNWLSELISVGETNPKIGILGAVQLTYSENEFNSWTTTAVKEHLPELSNPQTARPLIPVSWVEGSCFAVKRVVIEEIGMLDPIYFMYYEEIDFCRRAQSHGYQVALVPRCRIHHYRGGTSKASQEAKRRRAILYDRSHLIYHATDLRRHLFINLVRYTSLFFLKCFTQLRLRRFYRIWDLISLQPQIIKSSKLIWRKWKADRFCMQKRIRSPFSKTSF